MDRSSDKEKSSSKRSREDHDHYSTKDHKHSSRDDKHRDSESHHRHRHRSSHRDYRESSRDRESKRELSHEPRDDKEVKSDRRERSHEPRDHDHRDRRRERSSSRDRREGSRERDFVREISHDERDNDEAKRKRKQREESEDGYYEKEEKRIRVPEAKRKERRRFGDKVKEEDDNGDINENGKRVVVNEVKLKEEVKDERVDLGSVNGGTSNLNGGNLESSSNTSTIMPESSVNLLPSKVSSISNTNENRGVTITRSHEVPGKSSTDGVSSAAGKSGSLPVDVLAKAKKTLQRKNEFSEKLERLKKMHTLNKVASSSKDSSSPARVQEGLKVQPPAGITGSVQGSVASISSASTVQPPTTDASSLHGLGGMHHMEAVKRAQEYAAKMGFRHDPQFAPLINMFPGQVPAEITIPHKPTKTPVLRLDALGREIDEHGNIVNVTKPNNLSTLKVNINKQRKETFQILKPELEVDPDTNPHFDPRMGVNKNKLLRPKRPSFQFLEEGKLTKEAEMMRIKSRFGEERAKDIKAREALHAKAKAAPDVNPNLIEVSERVVMKEKPKEAIPELEWWDLPILPAGAYGEVIDGAIPDLKLKIEKITLYVEHPRPIEPPVEPAPPEPQPLKLTKKEQKKLRTQHRLAREKERQEMIRQGLLEPPKPKVKMSNLMKVLGSEATQDPTKLEKEIRTAAAEREQAHIDRNIARKLTPAERRAKKEKKLFDDPKTLETIVSVYKINDLSNKKTRFKVDVNAHENRLTGCVVITEGMSVVVVEGGSKSIKRYGKLMLRRINWAEAVNEDEGENDNEEKPVNKCDLVWQGSVAKPSFHKFSAHDCVTEAAARKIFADAGVGHYWDLATNFSEEQI